MEMNYLYLGILIFGLAYLARMRFSRRVQDRRCIDRRVRAQHVPIERRRNREDRRGADRRV